jgi:hypothetical protein
LFVGLTGDEADQLPEIEEFIEDLQITWPNGYGASETLEAFQYAGYPSLWVIGTDGRIVWNEDSDDSLEEGIERALSQSTP